MMPKTASCGPVLFLFLAGCAAPPEAKNVILCCAVPGEQVVQVHSSVFTDLRKVERRSVQAVAAGSVERVRLLLDKGATAGLSGDAMFAAVGQNESGLITLLARHGASVNGRDRAGRTPLMAASDSCKYWHIGPLLAAGADPSLADGKGRTALQPQTAIAGETESCRKSLAMLQEAVRRAPGAS